MTVAKEYISPVLGLEVVLESVDCALEKGWWTDQLQGGIDVNQARVEDIDPAWVRKVIPEKIALIHSEISEALEDFRVQKMVTVHRADGKPEGFPSELADIVIRIYDLFGAMKWSVKPFPFGASKLLPKLDSVPGRLAYMHYKTSLALDPDCSLRDEDVIHHLSDVVQRVIELSDSLGLDLHAEIILKQAFNRTRTRRHGGKVC